MITEKKSKRLQTVKLWIALHIEEGRSGLLVLDESQKDDNIEWETISKDGLLKPQIITTEIEEPAFAPMKNSQAILFGEDLLHGGGSKESKFCRVSLEIQFSPEEYQPAPVLKARI